MRDSEPIRSFLERYAARLTGWTSSVDPSPVTPKEGRRRIASGRPWIDPTAIELEPQTVLRFTRELLEDLQTSASEEAPDLLLVQQRIDAGRFTPAELLRAVLEFDDDRVDRIASEIGVPSELLQFIGAYLARPYLSAATTGFDPTCLDSDTLGADCPACGHAAALALLMPEDGQRRLWCRHCGTEWPVRRIRCPSCGNSDAETQGYFTLEDDSGHRVDFCRRCRRYVKTVNLRETGAALETVRVDLEDLLTGDLDVAALREGFLPTVRAAARRNDRTDGSGGTESGGGIS